MTTSIQTIAENLYAQINDVLVAMAGESDKKSEDYKLLAANLTSLFRLQDLIENQKIKNAELAQRGLERIDSETVKAQELVLKDTELRLKKSELAFKIQELDDSYNKISKTQVATITAQILSLIAILQHERAHVIGTKAAGFVGKLFR